MAEKPRKANEIGSPRLLQVLKVGRERLLSEWEAKARSIPSAAGLGRPVLRDSLPDVLDSIASRLERTDAQLAGSSALEDADRHARDRLADGFDLDDVVQELSLLRECVLRLSEGDEALTREWQVLNDAIDRLIHAAAKRFSEAHGRTIRIIDRIVSAAYEADSLDDLLRMLIAAFSEETPAVDTMTIYLVENGHLRLRSAAGLEAESIGFTLGIGDGFAGRVAAERRPLEASPRSDRSPVRNEPLRHASVLALHGAPLIDSGDLIGVACMGSLTVSRFSREDRVLFASMANRASAAIAHHMLLATAEQRAREQAVLGRHLAFLTEASALLASTLDYARTLEHVTRLAVPRLADWCIVDLLEETEGAAGTSVVAHKDPEKAALLRELRLRHPLRADASDGVPKALRSGRPVWIRDVDETRLREIAADDAHVDALRRIGIRSALIFPLNVDGRTIGTLALAQADSGRRFEAEDVEQLQEVAIIASTALRNAMLHAEAHRAAHLRDRILGIVSHDLRNPLGTIGLVASLLKAGSAVAADPAAIEHVRIIERNVERARRLIDDLLDLSSIQAGELAIEQAELALEPVLREAIQMQRPEAESKGIALTAESLAPDAQVLGDRDRLLQVLGNVIGNAVKYCAPGDRVTLRSEASSTEVTITCRDTGPGIPPEKREKVFDPYTRGGRSEPGTGLGLFITKGIVEAHGGRVWIDSEPGAGTSVHIALPRHVAGDRTSSTG